MHSDTALGAMTSGFWGSSVNDGDTEFESNNVYLEVPCKHVDESSEPGTPLTPISPTSELESDFDSVTADECDNEDDELNGRWLMPTTTEPAVDYQDEYVYQVLSTNDDDEFPLIHEFTTAWNFTPPAHTQLPSIWFTPSGSPPNNLHSLVPLQDFNFGRQLTVLDHHAVNVVHPPMSLDAFASGQDDFLSPPSISTASSRSSLLPLANTSASSSPAARANPYSGTGITVQDALMHLWRVIPEDWSCGCWSWEQGRWTAIVDQITDKPDEAPVEYVPSQNKDLRRNWDRKRNLLAAQMNGRIVSGELPRPHAGLEIMETIDEERELCRLGEELLDSLDDIEEEDYPIILRTTDEQGQSCEATMLMHTSPFDIPTHTASGKPIEIYDPDAEDELPDLTGW